MIQQLIQQEIFRLDHFGRVIFESEVLSQAINDTKEFMFQSGADWNVACHNSRCG